MEMFRKAGDYILKKNEKEHKQAHHNTSPPGVKVSLKSDERLNEAQDKHAHKRARHETHTAAQEGATDDHRCDRVEFETDARGGVPGLGIEGVNDAGEGGTEA